MEKGHHTTGVFLTVKDLMILTGSDNYKSTARAHKAIRDNITIGKKKLTIQEYCEYECVDYKEIITYLNTHV